MIKITLPDNSVREYAKGTSGMEIAKSISEGLARVALGIFVNDTPYDLARPIEFDANIRLVTFDNPEGKAIFWHSSAHLMAEALEALYPGTKFGIGPSIENGFYYDVDIPNHKLTADELPNIEKKMKELAAKNSAYERIEIGWQEAVNYFTEKQDEYKLELLNEFKDQEITLYRQGEFTDLCRGTHIPHTGLVKSIKLLSIAGAYWRGKSDRQMMTRIYGITFPKNAMLEEFLRLREEAERRDHRRLGKELELFTFSSKVGQGLPLWLPKGAIVRNILESYMRNLQRENQYEHVITPHIGQKELYVTSGHYAKYGADSFQPIHTPQEGEEFLLKPMNCPHHCEIYASRPRSYKELPLRLAEFGTVYRYEQSGELHGLTRVRGFTQDDAHLFCMPEQIKDEFKRVIRLIQRVFKDLGFDDYFPQVSLRDPDNKEKYIGSDEVWEKAETAIIEATQEMGMQTIIEYGEAAFYGPKLDFMVRDAIGRKWQLGTIQVDYNLPERFELEYTGADNQAHRPVMIHQAPFGSMERFMAILIEHFAGNFPYWLAPVQVSILPISDAQLDYAKTVEARLKDLGIRTSLDARAERVNRKIAESEQKKIPFALVLGKKEEEEGTAAVREHGVGDKGAMSIDSIIALFQSLAISKSNSGH